MREAPARRRSRRPQPNRFTVIPGGRDRSGPPPDTAAPALRPPPLVILALGVETFFFTGLLAIAVALRAASVQWPPAALPPLPVATTCVHTAILLFSALTMRRAMVAAQTGRRFDIETGLAATALLGFAFVAGQSAELVWLFSAGLAPAADAYTTTFLALVVAAAAHVVCGIVWIVAATTGVVMGGRTVPVSGFVRSCAIFWYYGCALWVPVFALLYLV